MYKAKYSVKIPAIIAGIPIPESRNPFIASPVSDMLLEIELDKCSRPRIQASGALDLDDYIGALWSNLVENMGLSLCADLKIAESMEKLPLGGVYASLTSALYYSLGKAHGESPSARDIVEILSLADPITDESFKTAIDALRYSATSGYLVAYRDISEIYEFKSVIFDAKVRVDRRVSRESPRLTREHLGLDLYSAIVHTAGLTVLMIAEYIRDSSRPIEAILRYKPILDAIAVAVWDLDKPPGDCLWTPALPGLFELLCFER